MKLHFRKLETEFEIEALMNLEAEGIEGYKKQLIAEVEDSGEKEILLELIDHINSSLFYDTLADKYGEEWRVYTPMMKSFAQIEPSLSSEGMEYSQSVRSGLHCAVIKLINKNGYHPEQTLEDFQKIHLPLFALAGVNNLSVSDKTQIVWAAGINGVKHLPIFNEMLEEPDKNLEEIAMETQDGLNKFKATGSLEE